VFDNKHLNAIIIKPSFFNNSFFSPAFHANYFKISEISLIKSFLNLKKFIFINENDDLFFKKLSIRLSNDGQFFKKSSICLGKDGQFFKKSSIRLGKDGQFFKKSSIRLGKDWQLFQKMLPLFIPKK